MHLERRDGVHGVGVKVVTLRDAIAHAFQLLLKPAGVGRAVTYVFGLIFCSCGLIKPAAYSGLCEFFPRKRRPRILLAQRRDIARMENSPPPTFILPAEIRNWLTGVPA